MVQKTVGAADRVSDDSALIRKLHEKSIQRKTMASRLSQRTDWNVQQKELKMAFSSYINNFSQAIISDSTSSCIPILYFTGNRMTCEKMGGTVENWLNSSEN